MDGRQVDSNGTLRLSAAEECVTPSMAALEDMGPGDTTGTDTLQRYHYQCKVAVQRWLRTLTMDVECYVICEFVDDITIATESQITFVQVKTRDRGAWTTSKIEADGGGLDSLVRSYNQAKAAGHSDIVRLELLLEGPAGPGKDTTVFFSDPRQATEHQRERLVSLGLATEDVNHFLECLTITPQYHPRQSIDAVTLQMLMGIAPAHSSVVQEIYNQLLSRSIAAHLGLAAQANPDAPLVLQSNIVPNNLYQLEQHSLSRSELVGLLPWSPVLASEQRELLMDASSGPLAVTDLEFKLRVAGANDKTVSRAIERRAEASAILEGRTSLADELDPSVATLRHRLLEFADGVVDEIVLSTSQALRSQPANAVWGRLVQQIEALGNLDNDCVFQRDGYKVLGYLCDISDQCDFSWRQV